MVQENLCKGAVVGRLYTILVGAESLYDDARFKLYEAWVTELSDIQIYWVYKPTLRDLLFLFLEVVSNTHRQKCGPR